MLCYSCGASKYQLHPVKSVLVPGNTLLMCQTCIDSKYEPRWIIILAGRTYGIERVRDFILKRRYLGKEIFATDLIV